MTQNKLINNYLSAYCRLMEITEEDIKSDSRKQTIFLKRHIFHWYMRNQGYLCVEIGLLTNRGHSTVTYSCKVINNYIHSKHKVTIELINRIK